MLQEKLRREASSSKMFTYSEKSSSSLNQYYKNILINVVHSSYKSDTVLRIVRKPLTSQTISRVPPQQENPYAIQRKSYSRSRNVGHNSLGRQMSRCAPSKRVKRDLNLLRESSSNPVYDLAAVVKETQKNAEEFLDHQFRPSQKKEEQNFNYSFSNQDSEKIKKRNPMLKSEIDIISNSNQKISVLIHDALLKSNTNHEKLEKDHHFLQNVTNPFNYERKSHYLNNLSFIKDYKSGYAPIDMQIRNSDEADETYLGATKPHFIRKKQSTLSLPRSCGVSYIKPSQSKQGKPYEPLAPLIFQCSSNCKDVKEKFEEEVKKFILIAENSWIPFIKTDENNMRDLLLGKKVGEVGWVKGIQNLWPMFVESMFILLLFGSQQYSTEKEVWKLFQKTIFKIGILTKKSTSGKKSFFKSIGLDSESKSIESKQKKSNSEEKHGENQNAQDENAKKQQKREQEMKDQKSNSHLHETEEKKQLEVGDEIIYELRNSKNIITLSIRLEMYVSEFQWKNASSNEKDLLCTLITCLKERLEKQSLQIIKARMNLSKSSEKEEGIKQFLRFLKKPIKSDEMEEENIVLNNSEVLVNHQNICKFLTQTTEKDENKIVEQSKNFESSEIAKMNKTESAWQKTLKMHLYYISTRDSFAFDLVEKITYHERNGHQYKKIEYFFEPQNLPSNYSNDYKSRFPNLNVGVTCYHNFFSNEQLKYFEEKTFQTEQNAFRSKFLQMTVQPSIVGTKIKRTKFFFGYRYMWTRTQLAQPGSYIGAGVRKDVTPPPSWTKKIQNDFVEHSIVEKDFLNSIAINVYHDGKEGLAQHFDDAVRFKQPIYTLRLFSDARLSFGSQFYGFCNGAFIVPLPRGCICVMEENSYAANGVKHCVRPYDMTGKSAAVILRQMHHQVVNEASRYDELIDFPSWVSTLSKENDSISFAEQKRRQAEYCLLK